MEGVFGFKSWLIPKRTGAYTRWGLLSEFYGMLNSSSMEGTHHCSHWLKPRERFNWISRVKERVTNLSLFPVPHPCHQIANLACITINQHP